MLPFLVVIETATGKALRSGRTTFETDGSFDPDTESTVEIAISGHPLIGPGEEDWFWNESTGAFGPQVHTVVLTASSYQAAASAVNSIDDGVLWGVSVASAERDSATVTFTTTSPDELTAEALSRGWTA